MNDTLESEIIRIKNLKQNRKKDIAVIEKMARYALWKKQIDIGGRFTLKEDQKLAEDLLDNYIENYNISTFNDMQNVADLVCEETLKTKLQKDINKITSQDTSNFIPDKLIKSLHEVEDRIWVLKEKIGITSKTKQDDLSTLQQLQERMDVYIPFHRNEFTTVCAGCGKPLLLRRRCGKDNWENLKHPMFSGRHWYNRRAMALVKNGLITKEIYAWIFHTSPSYVTWCIENEHKIVEIDNVAQEDIEKFIRENPYLKDEIIPSKLLSEKTI